MYDEFGNLIPGTSPTRANRPVGIAPMQDDYLPGTSPTARANRPVGVAPISPRVATAPM